MGLAASARTVKAVAIAAGVEVNLKRASNEPRPTAKANRYPEPKP